MDVEDDADFARLVKGRIEKTLLGEVFQTAAHFTHLQFSLSINQCPYKEQTEGHQQVQKRLCVSHEQIEVLGFNKCLTLSSTDF